MKNTTLKTIKFTTAIAASLFLAACGGKGGGGSGGNSSGSSGSGGSSGTQTDYAPNSLPSGTNLSINPKISLTNSVSLTYSNPNGADSAFTPTLSNATWAYTPYTNGPTTGTLTVAGDGGVLSSKHFTGPTGRTAVLLTFQFANHVITGGTATINGSTYAVNFSGSLLNAGTGPSTGGTNTAKTIESKFEGTWALNFKQIATGSGYNDGDKVTFQLTNDALTFNGKTLAGPVGGKTNPADNTMSGPPWDFTDSTSGVTMRFNPYSTSNTVLDPSFTVIKGGSMLGIFTANTSTTTPPGSVTPLLNKVHTVVVTQQDDPNNSTSIGSSGTFKFTSTDPNAGAYELRGADMFSTDLGTMKSNANGSQWSSSGDSLGTGDVSIHNTVTVNVNTATQQVTDITVSNVYSRNGSVFRSGTMKYQVTNAN
jgi:hypothetical protein